MFIFFFIMQVGNSQSFDIGESDFETQNNRTLKVDVHIIFVSNYYINISSLYKLIN